MSDAFAVDTPLELLWRSVGTLLMMDKKRFFETSLSAAPSPFHRNSTGAPLHVARKSERTTSPLERYDFQTIRPFHAFAHSHFPH